MPTAKRKKFKGPHIKRLFGKNEVTLELINETEPPIIVGEGDDDDTRTGIQFRAKDRLVVTATGTIYAGVWLTGRNGPQGWNNIDHDNTFPLPGTHPFSLLGRLDGRYFYIGRGVDFFYSGNGSELRLRINDDTPANGDGNFKVTVQQWREV